MRRDGISEIKAGCAFQLSGFRGKVCSYAGFSMIISDHHIDREVFQAVSLISCEEIEEKVTEKLYRKLILIWREIQSP